MCFALYLSTTSQEDFSLLPTDHYRFFRIPADWDSDVFAVSRLRYPNRWAMDGYGGCGCQFRRLLYESVDLGFGPPEDWFPEDEDNIEATIVAFHFFARLVREGHGVDVVDVWTGEGVESIQELEVSVDEMPAESFRFFQNYRFNFVRTPEGSPLDSR